MQNASQKSECDEHEEKALREGNMLSFESFDVCVLYYATIHTYGGKKSLLNVFHNCSSLEFLRQ